MLPECPQPSQTLVPLFTSMNHNFQVSAGVCFICWWATLLPSALLEWTDRGMKDGVSRTLSPGPDTGCVFNKSAELLTPRQTKSRVLA